jgi:xylitol oxidase
MALLEERLTRYEPRPHWGKLFGIDPWTLARRYPRHADFTALTRRLDPTGKFRNDLLDLWFPG